MAKLSLMFENRLVKEVPIGTRPVGIGRSPDNDLPVDNLAVSNHHARVFFEAGRLVVEDLDSLNGTFVNDLRVERATLHDGDSIWVGKHHIKVDASGEQAPDFDPGRKASAPKINETMVLDTKARRDMLQQAATDSEVCNPTGLLGILRLFPELLPHRVGDGFPHNLRGGFAADIGREVLGLRENILDATFDGVGGFGFAEVGQHHGAGPDLADGIGYAFACYVRRGAVHGLKHRGTFSFGVEIS